MEILIWGTGRLAARYMKFSFFAGYEIIGFVDSYKTDSQFMGYRVYRPEDIGAMEYDYLVICVAKENDIILETCIAKGIDLKKVFFAVKELDLKNANQSYVEQLPGLDAFSDIFPALYNDIKRYRNDRLYYKNINILCEEAQDSSLIRDVGENHVVAWIPVELLFSERQEDNHLPVYTDEWKQQNRIWENHPIISFEPYRNLFQFFLNGTSFPDKYCKWFQYLFISRGLNSGYTDEQLIEKRYREFMNMQRELNRGMTFFIERPAVAKWNSKGYFNLLDGHHRTSFLYYSGLTRMPVQITRGDYELWSNKETALEVRQFILEQKREEFYQPILNPYFFKLHTYREGFSKSRLHHLLEHFNATRFAGKKVVDIGACLGYMGQAFCRMGADVTLIEHDPFHYELTQKMNDLLYTNCRIVTQKFEEYEEEVNYDIAIMLTVFYPYLLDETIRGKFMDNLNKNVSQMIIWESGDEAEKEKEYILQNTKFHRFKHLCYTYATGKFRELGLFMTDDSEYLTC